MPRPEYCSTHRREFMKTIARQTLGVSFAGSIAAPGLVRRSQAAAGKTPPGKAKHIIYLFMDGAMSHLDTFDPKVGVEEAGETKPIQSRVARDGVR